MSFRIPLSKAKALGLISSKDKKKSVSKSKNVKIENLNKEDSRDFPPNEISFVVPGRAVPKERPRTVRDGTVTYTPKRTLDFEKTIKDKAWSVMRSYKPYTGPVKVSLRFFFKPPQSWPEPKKEAALEGLIVPTGRPDLDNIAKAVLDGLNDVLIIDDAQIVSKAAEKLYGEEERIEVIVEKVQSYSSRIQWKKSGPVIHDGEDIK